MHNLGEKIKQIRLSVGETMEQFGKRFNTSKGTVNNWEKNRNMPNKDNLLKIAKIGGITVEELLFDNSIEFIERFVDSYLDILSISKDNIAFVKQLLTLEQIKNEFIQSTLQNMDGLSYDELLFVFSQSFFYFLSKKPKNTDELFLSVISNVSYDFKALKDYTKNNHGEEYSYNLQLLDLYSSFMEELKKLFNEYKNHQK